jgi:hypothetical protein
VLNKLWQMFLGVPEMRVDESSLEYYNRINRRAVAVDSKVVSGPTRCQLVATFNGKRQRFESSRQGQFILATEA